MNKIYFRVYWLIIFLMLPWVAYAAGLGKLTLGSSLGQPFKAEIELVSVAEDEMSSLTARVAPPEAFRQAGVIYAPYHSSLNVSVETRVNGQPYIRVTSPQTVDEPFVNLLIELSWSSGRLLREYTVLLDPADTQAVVSAKSIIQRTPDLPQMALASGEAIQSKSSADQRSVAREVTSYKQRMSTYGPVARGDTLIKIAKQVSPQGVDLNQVLIALYQANRDAFFEKNMNLLKAGVVLRVPDQNEISAISRIDANREIKMQTADWHAYQERMADAAMGFSPKAELKQSAAGKVSTTLTEEGPAVKNKSPEEVLIVSKGEQPESAQVIGNLHGEKVDTAQDYLQMMEEDTIAKDRALKEANERVALLEQNIERLQRLIEIKGTGMTEVQIQAEQSVAQMEPVMMPAPPSPVEAIPRDLIDSAPTHEIDHVERSEKIMSTQPAIPEPVADQVQPSASSEAMEIALLDQIMGFITDNLKLVGGLLVILLMSWLVISILRRRREESNGMDDAFEYAGAVTKDNVTASRIAELTPAATMGLESVQDGKKDSVSEFFGSSKSNDDESKSNLSESSSRFFFGKNINENLVNDRNADSDHDHAKIEFDQIGDVSAGPNHEVKFDMSDIGNDLSITAADRAQDANESEMLVTKEKSIFDHEFTLTLETDQADKETSSEEGSVPFSIDFPGTLKAPSNSVKTMNEVESLSPRDDVNLAKFNFADIKLDLDDEPEKINKDIIHAKDEGVPWDEVAVKINLAKAYLEMDDREGAKEILQEVMQEGDEEQQAVARSMLENLK